MRRGRPKHDDILTPREWEVLSLLRNGLSNQQIADALVISESTARYHVSEIISKLGVSSRHEAAAWQQPERRRRWRASLITLPFPRRIMAGSLIGASALVLLLLAAGLYVMDQRKTAAHDISAAAVGGDGDGSASLSWDAVPAASEVIAKGDPVGFKVCKQVTNWQRPDPLGPNEVYADLRFGKDGMPTPSSYFLAQSDFFDVPMADSASINKYMYSATGILEDQQAATVVEECNPGTFYQSGQGMTHSFNLFDHRIVASYRLGDNYVLVVDDSPKSWQAVYLPYPPENSTYQRNFTSVQFVDSRGRLLFREQALGPKRSIQMTRYDGDGIVGATFSPASTALLPEFEIETATAYSLYQGFDGYEGVPQIAGSVSVRDNNGAIVQTVSFGQRKGQWDALARLELTPGRYRLEFALQTADTGRQDFLLLRDDQPLP
jgi:DNA-binding CsgD family transcriptional regulator